MKMEIRKRVCLFVCLFSKIITRFMGVAMGSDEVQSLFQIPFEVLSRQFCLGGSLASFHLYTVCMY